MNKSTKILGSLALVSISYFCLRDYTNALHMAKENLPKENIKQSIIYTTTFPDFNYQDLFIELSDGRLAFYQDINNDGLVDLIRTYNPKTKLSEFALRKNAYCSNKYNKYIFDSADKKLKELMKK